MHPACEGDLTGRGSAVGCAHLTLKTSASNKGQETSEFMNSVLILLSDMRRRDFEPSVWRIN